MFDDQCCIVHDWNYDTTVRGTYMCYTGTRRLTIPLARIIWCGVGKNKKKKARISASRALILCTVLVTEMLDQTMLYLE